MDEKDRLAGFRALLASHKTSFSYMEDPDGSRRQWQELSAEGRLEYITRDAALYNVSFEQFAQAVRESVDITAIGEAALRLAWRSGRELHELDKLLPDDSGTFPTPLVERARELINAVSIGHEDEEVVTGEKWAALLKEIMADTEAGKREDAHRCGKEVSEHAHDRQPQTPAEKGKKNFDGLIESHAKAPRKSRGKEIGPDR